MNPRSAAGWAAIATITLLVASVVVAFTLIGAEAVADRGKLFDVALARPWALLVQDGLKVAQAVVGVLLAVMLSRVLAPIAPGLGRSALIVGVLAQLALLANAIGSTVLVQSAVRGAISDLDQFFTTYAIVNGLAQASLGLNGVWYGLISVIGLQTGGLPRWMCGLGIALALVSIAAAFILPLSILVLLLALIWHGWLAATLLRGPVPHLVRST